MARREFPTSVKTAVIKRATRDNVIYCENCGLPARKFQIDHRIADAHGGEPVISNAQLICEPCYGPKNKQDTTIAAKIKRIEARHLGATRSKSSIPQRPKAERRTEKQDQIRALRERAFE